MIRRSQSQKTFMQFRCEFFEKANYHLPHLLSMKCKQLYSNCIILSLDELGIHFFSYDLAASRIIFVFLNSFHYFHVGNSERFSFTTSLPVIFYTSFYLSAPHRLYLNYQLVIPGRYIHFRIRSLQAVHSQNYSDMSARVRHRFFSRSL